MTLFARNPDTGVAKWAYQMTPHDAWDYDGINESILIDLPGENGNGVQKVLVHFDRNGFAYVLDRVTGKVISAKQFAHINWATGVDLETGIPIENPEKRTRQGTNVTDICPAAMGAKDQQPASYSPKTGLMYVPTNHLCMEYEGMQVNYMAGIPYVGAIVNMSPGPGGHRGEFIAWDPVAGEKKWGIKEKWSAWSGALSTAGDVVFYGTMGGWFKAVDANSGDELWKFKAGSGIIGAPMTYLGPDGKQYVAILSGIGGWSGLVVAADLATDDPTAALGAVGAFGELGKDTNKGGMLYVFALD
jgi:alcohol dehydrogenase (cytochrome c)